METIYKKISIEPFKKRIVKKHTNNNAAKVEYYPSFEQGNNRIAYDIKVEDDTVSPFLILDIKNNEKVLRYRMFCKYYYLCVGFQNKAKVYNRCVNGRWRENADEKITVNTVLPIYSSTDNTKGESMVIIYEDIDILKPIVKGEGSLAKRIITIAEYCKKCFNGDVATAIPYADISIHLQSDVNDQGEIETALPKWKGGEEYKAGVYTIYKGNIYKSTRDITITLKQDGSFETPSDNDSGWKLVTPETESTPIAYSDGITEARSSMFLSKKTYIEVTKDEYGIRTTREYPFYEEGGEFYFPYIKREISVGEGAAKLDKIKFNDIEIETTGDTGQTVVYSFKEIYDQISEVNTVTFVYYLYDTCENKENITWDNAVKYEETHKVETGTAPNGKPYFYIPTGDTQGDTNMNEDMVKENRKPKFATVSYIAKKEKYSDEDLAKINSFIKISPIGIQNIKTNIDANIDRGSSALFERLNILGEVKSMRDLENYKNNFFDI